MSRRIPIVGIDEAGRGALAGPLIAAAVLIRDTRSFPFGKIKDSKKLSRRQREEFFKIISETCDVIVGAVSHRAIDRMGIQAANVLAVESCILKLRTNALFHSDYIGNFQMYACSAQNVKLHIHGEDAMPEIAAASIIAKVTRDRLMCSFDAQYPEYGFRDHVGYGTRRHYEALRENGLTSIHRRSFIQRSDVVYARQQRYTATI